MSGLIVIGPMPDGLYSLGFFEAETFFVMDRFVSFNLAQAFADKSNTIMAKRSD